MAVRILTTTKAGEKGTYILTIAFLDEDDVAVVPNAIAWSLYNDNGSIVNSREDVAPTPASTINIVLEGDDLALPDSDDKQRTVLLKWDYNSTLGNNLPAKQEIIFGIENLVNVT